MNILGKRPQREFFPGENESLSSELKSVLSKKVNCEIFSRQLLLAIKNDCSGRRFSKKHDQIQASFVLYHTFKKNIIKLTIVDNHNTLGIGGYKIVKKGVEILFDKTNYSIVDKKEVAIIRDIGEVESEINRSSKLFHQVIQITDIDRNQELRIVPPPKLEEIAFNRYGNEIEKTWFSQKLAEGDLETVDLSTKQQLQIFIDLLPTLKFLQSKRIRYGDWSPDNILIFKENDQFLGKIADWDMIERYSNKEDDKFKATGLLEDSFKFATGYTTTVTDLHCFWKTLFWQFLRTPKKVEEEVNFHAYLSFEELIEIHGDSECNHQFYSYFLKIVKELKSQDQLFCEFLSSEDFSNKEYPHLSQARRQCYFDTMFTKENAFENLITEDFPLLTIDGLESELIVLQNFLTKDCLNLNN